MVYDASPSRAKAPNDTIARVSMAAAPQINNPHDSAIKASNAVEGNPRSTYAPAAISPSRPTETIPMANALGVLVCNQQAPMPTKKFRQISDVHTPMTLFVGVY